MATEVGTLLISMQTDLARLRKDMDEAKGITGRAMGDVSRSIDMVKNAIGLLGVGVTAGGLVNFAKQAVDAADDMAKLSQRVGIGTKELAQWKFVADLSGTSVESLGKGVKGLATYIQSHGDRLRALGIDTLDANQAMLQLADIVAALPDDMQQAALMSELFGAKIGAEMIPAFNLGSKGIAELKAKADDYATRLAQLAPDAEAFNDALTEMGLQSQIAAINIGNALIPGLSGMVQWLNDAAAGGDRAKTALQFLADMDSPLMRGLVSMHRALRPDEFTSNGWKLAGMDPVTGRSTAPAAGGYNPWGTDAAFMARTQASILLGGSKGGKTAAAKFEQSPAFLAWVQAQRAGESGLSAKEIMAQLHAEDAAAGKLIQDAEADIARRIDTLYGATAAGRHEALVGNLQFIETMRDAGRISEQQFAAITDNLLDVRAAGEDAFGGIAESLGALGNKAADTFADMLVDGKASFGDLVTSWLKDLARLQAKQALDPLTQAASSGIGRLLGNLFGGGSTLGNMATPSLAEEFPLGFASGGSLMVGGAGGPDSQLVAFRATPGERVTIETPAQQAVRGGSMVFHIDARGADPGAAARIEAAVQRAVRLSVSAVAYNAGRGGAYAKALGRA